MSHRALGPQFTTKSHDMFGYETDDDPKYTSQIVAYRGKRAVGKLSVDKVAGAVHEVYVQPRYRRQGAASQMLDHARQLYPGLQHSTALHPDGAAFAKARP